jgi:fatty acid desaturase
MKKEKDFLPSQKRSKMEWYWWLLIIIILLILAIFFRGFLGVLFWVIVVILAIIGLYVVIRQFSKKN